MHNDNQRALSDDDLLALMFVSPFLIPIAIGLVPGWAEKTGTWLRDHHILVDPVDAMWVLPGLDAGVDGRRLVLCAAITAILLAGMATAGRAAHRRRMHRRLQSGDRL